MEHGDVIDIDDLLGESSPEASLPLEEYNLDNFLESSYQENGPSKTVKSGKASHHGHRSKNSKAGRTPSTPKGRSTEYLTDVTSEAFLDSLLSSVGQSGLSDDDCTVDINSEELRRFISEFQDENGDLANHHSSERPLEECVSISSGTSESLDSSVSGEGVGGSKLKQNRKMRRGMRDLVANLIRNKSTAMASRSLGGEDERHKDPRRQKVKEKSKRREEKVLMRQSSDGQSSQGSFSSTQSTSAASDSSLQWSMNGRSPGDQREGPHPGRWDSLTSGMNEEMSKLFRIALEEDKYTLEQHLRRNPSQRDSRDRYGNTLLHVLCRYGKLESVRWLASGLCGHHVSMENNSCFTPTALAVKNGQLHCVEWLVSETKAKAELQVQDNRWSLLHIAARFGQEPCLRWLLQSMQNAGIHPDSLDRHGNSPAHLASRHGHLRCLQTLVEFNCDVTMVNGKKHTPCGLATKYNHDTCAQFLVVTETCVSLSDQVMQLRRELREYHQEKADLKAKLDDALSCSEALVRMQPPDVSQRVEQVQHQYVDLTNLLVRRIDDMHQQWKKDAARRAPSTKEQADVDKFGNEIAVAKQRASELQDSCSQLLEEDQTCRGTVQEGELSRIQEKLQRLQFHSDGTSPSFDNGVPAENHGAEPLKTMRDRLSEVSLLRAASPSGMNPSFSDKHDDISLSSSYTSLSSSSSSLSLMWNSPMSPTKPALQKQVSWEDQLNTGGDAPAKAGGTPTDETRSAQSGNGRQEQSNHASNVRRHLNDLISGKNIEVNTKQSKSSHIKQYYTTSGDDKDYATPTNSSPTDIVYSGRSVSSGTLPNNREKSLDRTKGLPGNKTQITQSLPDVINSRDAPRGLDSPSDNKKQLIMNKSGELSHSWNGGIGSLSKRRPLLSRLKLSSNKDSTLNSAKHVRHSSENSPLNSLKAQVSPKTNEDDILHRPVSSVNASSVQSMPGFMRKLQPSGQDARSSEVTVQVNRDSQVVNHVDIDGDPDGGTFHPRLNSDSSLSSTSSDVVWSDTDYLDGHDSVPMYKRRAGILNRTRKTGEGKRKSRDRHIKFAMDVEDSPKRPSPDGSIRRRDLSPIFESDAHRQQRKQSTPEFRIPEAELSPQDKFNGPMIGHREYRVNYYSSDDDYGTESPVPQDSPPITGPSVNGTSQSQHHGVQQDSLLDGDDEVDSFWYESSGDENEENKQSLNASIGSTAERHICYL